MVPTTRAAVVYAAFMLIASFVSACASSNETQGAETATKVSSEEEAATASDADDGTAATDDAEAAETTTDDAEATSDDAEDTDDEAADDAVPARLYSDFDLDAETKTCVDEAVADDDGAVAAIADDEAIDRVEPRARGVLMASMIECGVPVAEVVIGDGANAGAVTYAECIATKAGDDLDKVIAGIGFAENPPGPAEYRDVTIEALAACSSAGVADSVPANEGDRFTYLTTKCMETLGPERTKFLIDVTYSLGEDPTQDEVQAIADRYGIDPAEAVGGSMSCTIMLPTSVSIIETEMDAPLSDDSLGCLAELDPVELNAGTDPESQIAGCLTTEEAAAFAAAANQ